MSDGVTHSTDSKICSLVLLASIPFIGFDGFLLSVGCLAGTIISPDLDVDDGFIGFYIVRQMFGQPMAFLYRVFWYPYAILVSHRSWISHSPGFSTIFRLAYLLLIPNLLLRAFDLPFLVPSVFFVLGLMISDLLHICRDYLFS